MIRYILDFSYIFSCKKEQNYLLFFIALFGLFSLGFLPIDIPLGLALLLFVFAPVKSCFFMFSFYTLFEMVSVFSFGVTLNLVFQVILFGKVLYYLNKVKIRHRMKKVMYLFLSYWVLYGILSLFITGSPTGLAFVFRMGIVLFGLYFTTNDKDAYSFWNAIFHILAFSVMISVLFGIFNSTAIERSVDGVEGGYVSQLSGSLGTSRLGMFLASSLIYPLYFVENKKLKFILVLTFSTLTLLTISITACFAMMCVYLIYFVSLGKLRKSLLYLLLSFVILASTYTFWSKISFVQPIVARIEFATYALQTGDIDKATTGREDLKEYYMWRFHQRSTFNQIFGTGQSDVFDASIGKYAHNSYIDMFTYVGIFGVFLLFLYVFCDILYYKKTHVFYPVLSFKITLLIVAYTVSVFTSVYWTWFLFL